MKKDCNTTEPFKEIEEWQYILERRILNLTPEQVEKVNDFLDDLESQDTPKFS